MSSRLVNIPRSMDNDPFYRYKRIMIAPAFTNKNGGTTIIPVAQMATLSKQLDRSDIALTYYISKRSGTGVVIKGGYIHYHKTMSAEDIDAIVEQYINDKVLCEVCGNPETVEHSRGHTCRACGATTKN